MTTIQAMSKITFRADDDLVEQLEALELSKSEAMREALRAYLERGASRRDEISSNGQTASGSESGAVDDLIRERVDDLLEERIREYDLASEGVAEPSGPNDINITVSLDDGRSQTRQSGTENDDTRDWTLERAPEPVPESPEKTQCEQCGESVDADHVYCPNCGEKTSRRLFCECGDEIRSDWSFCPGCGRRTPAADVLGGDGHS